MKPTKFSQLEEGQIDEDRVVEESPPPNGGYGWIVVLASFLVLLFAMGLLFVFGIVFVALIEEFGVSRGNASIIAGICNALLMLASPPAAFLARRFGNRQVVFAAGTLIGLGLLLSSFAWVFWQLYFSYGLICGLGMGLSLTPTMDMVGQYFSAEKRSRAMAMAITGTGVGTFVLSPLVHALLEHFQWRNTLRIVALIMFIAISGCSLFLKPWKPFVSSVEPLEFSSLFDWSQFKKPNVAWVSLSLGIASFGYIAPTVHVTKFAIESGLDARTGSFLISAFGIGNFTGRLLYSTIGSLSGKEYQLYSHFLCSMGILSISLSLVTFMTDSSRQLIFFSYSSLYGMSYGLLVSVVPSITMNSVGLENFSRAYGIEIASQTLGSLIGPVISGVFADSIGSYSISFIILGIITSTGSLISYWKVRNPNSKCPKV